MMEHKKIEYKKIEYKKIEYKIITIKEGEESSLSLYEKNKREEFFNFPNKVLNYNPPGQRTLKEILELKSPLSKYLLGKHLLLEKGGVPLGRCSVFKNVETNEVFFGFYECIDDDTSSNYLIKSIEEASLDLSSNNKLSIIGPINGSFWTGYRFKTKSFDLPQYFGEPYNKPWYVEQFQKANYKTVEYYNSLTYKVPKDSKDLEKVLEKSKVRYNKFIEKGYEIKDLNSMDFNKSLNDIYFLIKDLYSSFPGFSKIDKETFFSIFKSMKFILRKNITVIAYKNDEPLGFSINFPDYGNLIDKNLSNPINILKVIFKKHFEKNSVFSYLGVKKGSEGLGLAMAYKVIKNLKPDSYVISSLIRNGAITASYIPLAKIDTYEDREYQLLSKDFYNKSN